MNTYNWRNTATAVASDAAMSVRGKIAFKTRETAWLHTNAPVVVLVSIHSDFHTGIGGDLKMNALMSTIKRHVQGLVTVLLSDAAHIQTLSLKTEDALCRATESADLLVKRYQGYFEDCQIVFWHSYIGHSVHYAPSVQMVCELYRHDSHFQKHLQADAEACYNKFRSEEYPEKSQFIEKTINDLLEQCSCVLVLAAMGYRYQFYPGQSHGSTEYVNRHLLPEEKRVSWIDVFLSIEKKTRTSFV